MNQASHDFRVGAFTFVGIILLGILILLYGEEPTWILTTRYELRVLVDNPTGIGEGTPAFMQGVQVGRVEEIKFRNPKKPSEGAAVIVGINDDFDIPSGSEATIHPGFAFDQGAIHIVPPPYASEPIAHGGEIEGEMAGALESIVPKEYITNLGEAVDQMRQTADQIGRMASKIGVVSDDLHELMQIRTKEAVDDPDQHLPANFFTLVQRADQTLKLLNAMADAEGDFNVAVRELRESFTNLNQWTQGLDEQTDLLVAQADSTMKAIQNRSDEVGLRLLDSLGAMSSVLDKVNTLLTAVNEGRGALGKTIYDPRLYEELVVSVQLLQSLIQELRTAVVWIQQESVLKGGF